MRLQTKFFLCTASVLIAVMAIGGYELYRLHREQPLPAPVAIKIIVWGVCLACAGPAMVYVTAWKLVGAPLRRMSRQMLLTAQTRSYDRPLREADRSDELGLAARAFNHMLGVVCQGLEFLCDANEQLDRRVMLRTAELAAKNAQLAAVHDASLDAILTIDDQGRITQFNHAAEKILGHRSQDVLGKPVEIIMPPHLREEHRDQYQNYLRTATAR